MRAPEGSSTEKRAGFVPLLQLTLLYPLYAGYAGPRARIPGALTCRVASVGLADPSPRFGGRICGVDVVASDITTPLNNSNGTIVEVNACPGLRMHLNPSKGTARNVAEPILDMLFPKGQNGIPKYPRREFQFPLPDYLESKPQLYFRARFLETTEPFVARKGFSKSPRRGFSGDLFLIPGDDI